ncbi:hypothetical protein J6590_042392 [Homalodisca vitripennis]|nr:hypothetical protein J6590_042392 [Homalodisca vitripennis]
MRRNAFSSVVCRRCSGHIGARLTVLPRVETKLMRLLLLLDHRYNVEEEVCNRLEELILEKKMMMHVLDTTESNVLIVQMLDNKMQDIGTMLEVRAPQSPIYNEYQATTTPTYTSRPPAGEADPGREGAAHGDNSWEERKYPDSKGPRGPGFLGLVVASQPSGLLCTLSRV